MISLRPATDAYAELLAKIYESTRSQELAAVQWPLEQRAAFLEMQFRAQHADYHHRFPDASYDVIEIDGEPAGRLYVHRGPDHHQILDVALLPAFRGQGVGTTLLQDAQTAAASASVTLRLHVEVGNPAATLYERLGFIDLPAVDEDPGIYRELEWTPAQLAQIS